MPRDVYLVLVEYGPSRGRAALDLLTSMLERVCPGTAVRSVVVDNGSQVDECATTGVTRITGDNTLHEFSGFDRGLAWIDVQYRPAPDALVVLANDTIARNDKCERVRALTAGQVHVTAEGAIVGHVDEYPRPVELFGLTMRQFVDTSLVLAQHRILRTLRPLACVPGDAVIFGDNVRTLFRQPSPLSENYRGYLERYFFGRPQRAAPANTCDGFEHDWYAQAPLAENNIAMFKAKLRCVFCEHLFSARARALRIPIADIRPVPLPIDPFDTTVAAP